MARLKLHVYKHWPVVGWMPKIHYGFSQHHNNAVVGVSWRRHAIFLNWIINKGAYP